MPARLLPPKDLTALLCRYCYGETPDELAEAYELTRAQVVTLLTSYRDTRRHMRKFLGFPRRLPRKPTPKPKRTPGILRKCNRCRKEFWTDNRLMFSCGQCKTRDDWRHGTDFHAVPLRGMG